MNQSWICGLIIHKFMTEKEGKKERKIKRKLFACLIKHDTYSNLLKTSMNKFTHDMNCVFKPDPFLTALNES